MAKSNPTVDDVVNNLWQTANSIAIPDDEMENAIGKHNLAADSIRTNTTYMHAKVGVKGVDIINKFDSFAETYLKGAGFSFTNTSQYANQFRNMLGRSLEAFKKAISKGDMEEMLKLSKDALLGNYKMADYGGVNDRFHELDTNQQTQFANLAIKVFEPFGANNPMLIVRDPIGYLQRLVQVRTIAADYKTK